MEKYKFYIYLVRVVAKPLGCCRHCLPKPHADEISKSTCKQHKSIIYIYIICILSFQAQNNYICLQKMSESER